jgi:hypothetical protein
VTTLTASSLRLTVDQVNAETSTPVTVFLPSGVELGQPAPVSPAVRLARNGRSFSAEARGVSRCWWPWRAWPTGPR